MGFSTDLAYALSAVHMAEAAGYPDLDDWQSDVLRAMPRRLLLNCSRQSGKTLLASLMCVHQAVYEPGSLAVVVAQRQDQAMELIRTCRTLYAALGRPVEAESENKLSLELENGSRIRAIPSTESSVRGLSNVGLLVIDEASRVLDATYAAVLPFLAVSDGRLALLSTPAGCRGFFYDSYLHREEWHYVEVKATAVKRIPATFLAEARRKVGEYYYSQEWLCAFNDSEQAVFRQEDIDAMFKDYAGWDLSA